MPTVPLNLIRALLGLLAIFFGYFFGKSFIARREGRTKRAPMIAWALRTAVALAGLLWTGRLDWLSIAVIVLTLASIAGGAYSMLRPNYHADEVELDLSEGPKPKPPEDRNAQ